MEKYKYLEELLDIFDKALSFFAENPMEAGFVAVLLVFSLAYGLSHLEKPIEKDMHLGDKRGVKIGVSQLTLFGILFFIVVISITYYLGNYLAEEDGRDAHIGRYYSDYSESDAVQLNDSLGAERIIAAYNQALEQLIPTNEKMAAYRINYVTFDLDEASDRYISGYKGLSSLLEEKLRIREKYGQNYGEDLCVATSECGTVYAFDINGNGYVYRIHIWDDFNVADTEKRADKRNALKALSKSAIAVPVEETVLQAWVGNELKNKESNYMRSLNAKRDYEMRYDDWNGLIISARFPKQKIYKWQ